MKKTMITLAAVAMVSFANAASVNWNTGNMSTLPSYATMWVGQNVSFYLTTSGYDLTTIINGLKNNDTSVLTGQTLDNVKGGALLVGAPVNTATVTGDNTAFKQFDVAYGYAVVWNKGVAGAGTLDFAISKVTASVAFGLAGNASLNFGGVANFTQYDVVPEPTSMALLALGAAAVGLRRRFKK